MRRLLLLAALAAAPALAQNEIPPLSESAQGSVAVTIYNNNLALVQDTRELDIAAGRSRREFPDVSAQIRPETVSLSGAGLSIVEQNFDFDLLSPRALMQKAVGETITLVRTNPATGAETRERALVLAANGGVVLRIGDRIEVLRDDGLPVRVIFDKVPENLRARPTLSVTVASERGGRRPVTLTYLTPGIGWKADYVALFDEPAGRMDVQGWITLTNNSGTPYVNASTMLVAGAVGQEGDYRPQPIRRQPRPIQQAGTETAPRERLGDFYLYPLPERTTIANAQTKQVSFLDVRSVPARRAYSFNNGWLATAEQPRSVDTVLVFTTGRAGGLGDAIPAGTVRVYQRDARGAPQFVGETAVGHIPMGSDVGLKTGEAFDIKVQPIVEKRERLSESRWRTQMRYTLTNASPQAVTVDLFQSGLDAFWRDSRIVSESQKSDRMDAGMAVWHVQVPANGNASVTATFDTRF
jgi:hypothetical protein